MSFLATDITNVIEVVSQLVAADTTVAKVLMTPQVVAVAYDEFLLTNTDGIDHHVEIIETIGGVSAAIAAVTVPAGTGVGGVPPVALFNPPFNAFLAPYPRGPGFELSWRVEEAVTGAFKVTVQTAVGIY